VSEFAKRRTTPLSLWLDVRPVFGDWSDLRVPTSNRRSVGRPTMKTWHTGAGRGLLGEVM